MAAPQVQTVPVAQEQDIEKKTSGDDDVKEVKDVPGIESDASSGHKQDGVKQVEAITTVWSKDLLVVMYIL